MTASVRAAVSPRLLAWARERSGLEVDELATRFPKLTEWERGERTPTLKQLEDFARATHTPIGLLFLPEPPEEQIPIPDYRTIATSGRVGPAPTCSTRSSPASSDRSGTGTSPR